MTIQRYILAAVFAVGTGVVTTGQSGAGGDWPQWQGPDRTGLSKETGLLHDWPASGPPLVWTAAGLGNGYGSVAIKGDRIYLQGMKNGDEHRVRAQPHGRQIAVVEEPGAVRVERPGRRAARNADG